VRKSLFLERGWFMFFILPVLDRLVFARRHFVLDFGRFSLDELGCLIDVVII
jgi:hypothetical protein